MPAIYNEFDAHAAQWLRNLIDAGLIAPGRVDDRSITELAPQDIQDKQFHAFGGIGIWSYALRLAGVRDDAPIFSGSCPCQPFSQAGHGVGTDDARHLWPQWFGLIRACRPPVVFGEQVASPAGLGWLDIVTKDFESAGYTVLVADLSAAGVGAPHIRQRLYFCAVRLDAAGQVHPDARAALARTSLQAVQRGVEGTDHTRGSRHPGAARERDQNADGSVLVDHTRVPGGRWHSRAVPRAEGQGKSAGVPTGCVAHVAGAPSPTRGLADSVLSGTARLGRSGTPREPDPHGAPRRLADDDGSGCEVGRTARLHVEGQPRDDATGRGASDGSFWSDCDWIYCRDSKWRPIEQGSAQPRTESLANEPPSFLDRVRSAGPLIEWNAIEGQKPSRGGLLRGYGNAIVAELAAEFISAVIETLGSA